MTTFRSNTYSRRSFDDRTAAATKQEKAAQKKVENRSRSAAKRRTKRP